MPPQGLPQLSSDPVLALHLWLGTLRDHSGYGNHGTVGGTPHWSTRGAADAIDAARSGRVSAADAQSLRFTENDPFTLFACVLGRGDPATSNTEIVFKRQVNDRYQLRFSGATSQILADMGDGVGALGVTSTTAIDDNQWHTVALVYDGANTMTLYIDAASEGSDSTPTLSGLDTTGADLTIGGGINGDIDALVKVALVYPSALSQPELATLHDWSQSRFTPRKQWPGMGLQYPGRGDPYTPATGDPMFLDNIQTARVTLANESSGTLSNTDYTIQSGTWAVKEDAATGERYIECITAGIISRRNLEAYGTWDIEAYKGGETNKLDMAFMADIVAAPATNTLTGYLLQFAGNERLTLAELTGAAQVALAYSATGYFANSTRYMVRVTRSATGAFYYYIKGGAFEEWTLVSVVGGGGSNPVTDNTNTASTYCVFDMDAGDRLYLDRQYAGVVTP